MERRPFGWLVLLSWLVTTLSAKTSRIIIVGGSGLGITYLDSPYEPRPCLSVEWLGNVRCARNYLRFLFHVKETSG
ncbi:hypothetical protein V8F20_010973 [Naviculisporaceae sp. PSN 640]